MSGTLAPNLQRLVLGDGSSDGGHQQELRALLSVARAAKGVFDPDTRGDPALLRNWKRLDRALARLERAGGKGR